ncbi:hypothetical protein DY000_02026177 [Brassica cretica]|uniref:KIB1-4 beta-propeller domain-containing protein n=1 Tax=Brassica cretica TaxID=69181 RepID=A0ABQ7E8B3_BRACR|nr:hypothetical protein DY000_02026177 [Brassica cretica]
MLSERRAALGLPVRDPQESDPTRQQPSNPTDYFENIETSRFFHTKYREKKICFEVSELDVERNDWNQVEDVDDRVLFLEQYCSFSCLATEIQGFRANSIIFSDLWGGTNLNEHESIVVYEFNEQGVRSVEDIPELC